ncbi:uncharacterized protein LOC131261853 isoform X2 [Anopheles coustani]|uniref:uncharacterized protein LOC131261853 isoform X2 n=1 Tax=Anopheles coustani TaxID=139045 RepID=UPI002658FEBE|nr:uncharacterized protein LOC131261853 isoform X2 [Anopheles coustani]
MGEVGANASETTASTTESSGALKENGQPLVNGGGGAVDDAGTEAATEADDGEEKLQKKDTINVEEPEKDEAVDGDRPAKAAEPQDGGGREVKGSELEEEKETPTSDVVQETQASAEKQSQQASDEENNDSAAEPSSVVEENSSSSKQSTVATGNHSHTSAAANDGDVSRRSETTTVASDSEEPQEDTNRSSATANGKSTPAKEVDAEKSNSKEGPMEVDEDENAGGEVQRSSSAQQATQNGDEKVISLSGDQDTGIPSREVPRSKSKSITDDEPMEVDGGTNEEDQEESSSVATNGHNEVVDGTKENEATNKEKNAKTARQEEEDDDKPVSINSDSEADEPTQQRDVPVTTTIPSKPKPNVIVVDEGGLIKLGEGGSGGGASSKQPAAAALELPSVGNGETTITTVTKSNPSSNGIQPAAPVVATGNQNGDCDGDVTILSDKEEDCVVIEDDDDDEDDEDDDDDVTEGDSDVTPATPVSTPTTASSRQSIRSKGGRSGGGAGSMVTGGPNPMALVMQQAKQQNQQIDDDDDDVEEIIDDPLALPVGKVGGRASLGGQQFTGSMKGTGQKSLLMSNSGTPPAGKESSLMIIDTNTLMNNNGNSRTAANNLVGNANSPLGLGKAPVVGMMGNNMAGSPGSGQFNSRSLLNSSGIVNATGTAGAIGSGGMLGKANASPLAPVTPLLPALTDDMFVLEAPSFIVPYIYEKPPVDNLRDILDDLEVEIKEMRKKLEESGAVPPADKASAQDSTATTDQQQGEAAKKEQESSAGDTEKEPDSKKRKRNNVVDDDDEWDELDTSTDDEASDEEQKTKVLIKEARADIEAIKEHIISPLDKDDLTGGGGDAKKQSENYFENPLGKFFMNIGINQVQEFVQTDLLRQQKRKRDREGKPSPSTQMAINSLMKNLEQSKENNKPYKFEMKRCEYCPFKSESALVMAHHYETPHMRNFIYKCNFCSYETRPPHDILYHMEAVHNIKGRMEKALSYHHCPNCPFEDNGKSKLARHAVACAKKFRPEANLNPPLDWEPPAKIPRIKPKHGLVGTATAYQAMTAQQQKNLALANQQRLNQQQQGVTPVALHAGGHLTHQQIAQQQAAGGGALNLSGLGAAGVSALNNVNLANLSPAAQAAAIRARAGGVTGGNNVAVAGLAGRAPAIISSPTGITAAAAGLRTGVGAGMGGAAGGGVMSANALAASAAAIRNTLAGAGMVIPNNLQLSASALAAAAAAGGFNKFMPNASSMKAPKTAQAPSISITPLPRQSASGNGGSGSSSNAANMSNIAGALSKLQAQGTSAVKPGQNPSGGGKTAFVVCEICDGYIKDLDQLRNHMQWIHKVKIHPKMIYNRPPLNCQKCQYRFFTDQGLERHLLGSHGLVTSSMQEAANKGKDAGRCPVCGRVYQWKLLNHVSRDHNMTLKPAHLSYKCTVCTATFGMYKQFESHVYSAHSTVAKKTVDSKGGGKGGGGQQAGMGGATGSSSGMGRGSAYGSGNDSLLKPLKINDEITIIPQPTSNSSKMAKTIELESHVID